MEKTKKRIAHSVDDMEIKENAKNKYKGLESPEQTALQTTFSTRLNNLLQERRVHQLELCKYTNISEGSISNYRNGKALPKAFELKKLSGYLKVSTDYLLGNTDVKVPNASIQTISKITGLDENAVVTLKETKNINSLYTRLNIGFLNYMISNGYIWKISNFVWEGLANIWIDEKSEEKYPQLKKDLIEHMEIGRATFTSEMLKLFEKLIPQLLKLPEYEEIIEPFAKEKLKNWADSKNEILFFLEAEGGKAE